MRKQTQIRKNALLNFGFGIEAMKSLTVCAQCSSLENSNHFYCSVCNAKLQRTNLYTLYKSQHNCCTRCKAVISDGMHYCPRCGIKVEKSKEVS